MAKITNKLTPQKIKALNTPGYHLDGAGLYLQVTKAGAKSWVYQYTINGKRREMGLGALVALPPDAARRIADEARVLVASGIDPIEKRKADTAASVLAANSVRTFAECATDYIAAHRSGWKNKKHINQWTNTLRDYVEPTIGKLSVADVRTEHVIRVLQKDAFWTTKNETANRVRVRIENILDWAKTLGYRTGENPARWRGHMENLLPSPSKVQKPVHHPALPVGDLPYFMADLRPQTATSAQALKLALLTATRTVEIVQAQWGEVDLEKRVWTIPADRMKAGEEHPVPLSDQAVELLMSKYVEGVADDAFIFSARKGKPLSTAAMEAVLDRIGYTAPVQQGRQIVRPMPILTYPDGRPKPHITVHGTCRSTFRDWVAEKTEYPRDLAEMALAHAIEDKTEAAYRRGTMLERRRGMMQDWANWLDRKPGEAATVTSIKTKRGGA
ncbi:MAG: integrase arm-type DNA-binding domain-containing protein [Rhodocyclaceae bacterium]|nr:integrase arm-type DNA-binding domain-containing protein [Rhodocyclaceae bacterium]